MNERLASRSSPLLIQMAGRPGVGKSTLANELGQALPAVVFDNDVIKSTLLDEGIEEELAAQATWSLLFRLAKDTLANKVHTILDNPSHYPEIQTRGEALARDTGARYVMIECFCDDDTELRRRLVTRPRLASNVTADEVEARGWEVHGPDDRIRVNTLRPKFVTVPELLASLQP